MVFGQRAISVTNNYLDCYLRQVFPGRVCRAHVLSLRSTCSLLNQKSVFETLRSRGHTAQRVRYS